MEDSLLKAPEDGLLLSLWNEAKSKAEALANFYGVTAGEVTARALGIGWYFCAEEKNMRAPMWNSSGEPLDIVPSLGESMTLTEFAHENKRPLRLEVFVEAKDAAVFLSDYWQMPPNDVLAKFIKVLYEIHAKELQGDYPVIHGVGRPVRVSVGLDHHHPPLEFDNG